MGTRFCPDCGLIVTMENGLDVLGQLRHLACVQRRAMNIIGNAFCGVDAELRAAVRGVKKDGERFVALLCLVADKIAMSSDPPIDPSEQALLDVLFEKFVAPRFDAALRDFPPEQAEELRRQLPT